jgi:phenylacetate-coenzyme A ligase PaaK-like adenylate-forming protein
LLTNLANRVQPMIRYDLGDSVTLGAEPCPCGSPLPTARVEGRRDDTLVMQTVEGPTVSLLPNALRRLTGEGAGVRVSQVVQTGPATLAVRLDVTPGADDAQVWARMAARLREYLVAHGLSHVVVERLPGAPQPDPASGKLRRVLADLGRGQR